MVSRVIDCLFCKIVSGDVPSEMVYETDLILAFRDVNPVAPTHVLVIPKVHIQDISGLEGQPDLSQALLDGCREVARLENITEQGFRVVTNTGAESGQSVFHLHLHVLGGRRMAWPPG